MTPENPGLADGDINGSIHRNEVKRFKDFLEQNGWQIQPSRITRHAFVARQEGSMLSFMKKKGTAHMTCPADQLHIYWIGYYRTQVNQSKKVPA